MSSTDPAARTALVTVLAPIAWGTTYLTVTETLPAGRPLMVAAIRVVPAGVVLVLVGRLISRWRPTGVAWVRVCALAVCNFACFFPLLIVAVYRMPGGVAASFGGVQPLTVAALGWLVDGRRPRRRDVVLGILAVIGVAMVVVKPDAQVDAVGVLAAIGANASFAMGVVLTKRFPAPDNPVAFTGWQLLVGGAVLVPMTLLVEGLPGELSGRNVAGFAYLSLVGTGLAYLLWFRGIRRLPPVAPSLLGLAAPVTGAALGWWVNAESLSVVQVAGFVLTLGTIAYGALGGPVAPRPKPAPVESGRVDVVTR